MEQLSKIASQFRLQGRISQISPLGNGLINDTYLIQTQEDAPDYVLQNVNVAVFPDIDLLMNNIVEVTNHIRKKLEAAGAYDIDLVTDESGVYVPMQTLSDFLLSVKYVNLYYNGDAVFSSRIFPTAEENSFVLSPNASMRIWKLERAVKEDFVV